MSESKDIIDQLHNDARRLRVARKLPIGELSWDWVARVQEDFKIFKENNTLSLAAIAKSLGPGFSAPTLSAFLSMRSSDDYVGDLERIVRGLNRYMEMAVRAKESPRPAGFVETKVSNRILTLIQNAIELRSIGVVYGPAGVGKSMSLEAAHSIFPGSIMIRARATAKSLTRFAKLVALTMKIKKRTAFDIEDALIEQLKGTDRPLFVDEAHHLTMDALEFLRDLHDECGIPIILVGTIDIEERVSDTKHWYGQFASRIGLRYDIAEGATATGGGGSKKLKPLFERKDIVAVFDDDKLRLTDDAITFMTQLANCLGLGCLRFCRQVIFVAAKMGVPEVTAETLQRVLRKMHGQRHTIERVERTINERTAQTA